MKMRALSNLVLTAIAVTVSSIAWSQGDIPKLTSNIFPPSPNMSALGKFIEQPVSKYTGIPQVDIPLYDIQTKDINLPITLRYHAGGRKVEEVASWTGLGWSLSAGGSVMRTVRGLPDDLYSINANVDAIPDQCDTFNDAGYLYCGSDIERMYNYPYNSPDSVWLKTMISKIGMGAMDGMPDMFYFSFGKYSGEFVLDKNGNIHIIPQQDLNIIMQRDQNGREIVGFKIITPEGVEYVFNEIERATITSDSYTDPIAATYGIEEKLYEYGPFFGLGRVDTTTDFYTVCFTNTSRITYNSAWQLTKVKSLMTGAEIDLKYRKENALDLAYTGESFFIRDTTNFSTSYISKSASATFTRTKVIDSITWTNGNANFQIDPLTPRKDRDARLGSNYALDKLVVRNDSDSIVKSWDFTYSYFISDLDPEFTWLYDSVNYCEKLDTVFQYRLKLSSLQEAGFMPYTFYYDAVNMPHRVSSKQDFWGYYTNATGDTAGNTGNKSPYVYEYPSETVTDSSFYTSKFSIYPRSSYTGTQKLHTRFCINRVPDITKAIAWNLTQLNYPTGGARSFTYEMNEFYVNGQKVTGGGLRLKEQSSFSIGVSEFKKLYNYHESGQVIDLPVFTSYSLQGIGKVRYESSWTSGLGLTNGSNVGYGMVTDSSLNGKTTDYFLIPAMYGTWSEEYFHRPVVKNKYFTLFYIGGGGCATTSDTTVIGEFYPKPYSPNYDWKRGLLYQSSIYNTSGILKARTKQFYTVKAYTQVPNVQVDVVSIDPYVIGDLGLNPCFYGMHCYKYAKSYNISPWLVLDSTVTVEFKGSDSMMTSIKKVYAGTNHKQLTSEMTEKLDGTDVILLKRIKYPFDYTSPAGYGDTESAAIRVLKSKNVKSIPIEISSFVVREGGSTYYLSNSSLNTLQVISQDSLLLPYKSYVAEVPFGYQSFQESSVISTSFQKDNNYREKMVVDLYDNNANPLMSTSDGYVKNIYLWSYDNSLPVAQINNGSSIDHCAYSSFEADGKGNWTYSGATANHPSSPTGNRIYNLGGGSITKSNLVTSSVYTITYWKRDSAGSVTVNGGSGTNLTNKNGWVLYSHEITGVSSITISGSSLIDELRLHLKTAQMKTVTYDPLIGITSECDPANHIVYYKYDVYRRLAFVLDQDRNILKAYEYKQQQSIENQ